ncbi:MAG: NADH-quinone oxidoreductase subunit M [Planctomycetota bacterium]|jgi:NADH-quinone oxidoreductase subunit M|nr:NADH-quinone oxidoreductase subunit M [Planctomycetota bacterium]
MLSLLLAAPFVAALVCVLGSGRDGFAATRLALVMSVVIAGLAGVVAINGATPVDMPWFTLWGTGATVHFSLLGDGISAWMALLALGLGPAAILASRVSLGDKMREFCAGLFALQGCLVGAFLAGDVVQFYFFFEAGLLPMAVLLAMFGDPEHRRQATMQFFLYTMLGSILMLVAIWYLAAHGQSTLISDLPATVAGLSPTARTACFAAFALAFAVKTPLMPFHSWQAPVYAACPAGAAVVLAGAMAKLGTYGFLRLVVPVFPEASAQYAWVFILLGVIGVVLGALMALAQRDLKRMLAFSSLSHLGLVVIGIFTFENAGLDGAVVQMVAHGLSVGALFLLIGVLEGRTGLRDIDAFGAVAGRAPVYAVLFVCAALAAVALPGTAGFVGEVMLLYGTFSGLMACCGLTGAIVVTLLAGSSLIFGAGYVLRATQRLLYGNKPEPGGARMSEITGAEGTAVGVLLVATLVLGLLPSLITGRSAETTHALGAGARAARVVACGTDGCCVLPGPGPAEPVVMVKEADDAE